LGGGLNLYGFAGGDAVNYGDPFGLKIAFAGTRARELEVAWGYAKSLLKIAAGKGDGVAKSALLLVRQAEESDIVFTFRSGIPKNGVSGETTPESGYREMIINEDYVDKHPESSRDYLTMMHEFGHATAHNLLNNPLQSFPQSLALENALRRARGFPPRLQHEGAPPDLRAKQ